MPTLTRTLLLQTPRRGEAGTDGADCGPDRLCLAPRHCTRASFFQKAPILLEASPDIADVRVISDAYAPTLQMEAARVLTLVCDATDRFVPVIKMTIDGIHVDLLFAALALDSIPDTLEILDDGILRDLDEQSVRRRWPLGVTPFSLRGCWLLTRARRCGAATACESRSASCSWCRTTSTFARR